jgi:hypothetical protein
MANYNDKQLREIFHLIFLERLVKISDPALYCLKGGTNLRFFLGSPRYSEDMDIDLFGSSPETLKKNGYKILEDPSFIRVMKTYGIRDILINDKYKAKHTETTQRFRLRLVNNAGEELPTKVEFSRRKNILHEFEHKKELINPEIIRAYNRPSFLCQHYLFKAAAIQKIMALAGRSEPQTRDPFDFFFIYSAGKITKEDLTTLDKKIKARAIENLTTMSYEAYLSQVVEYLDLINRSTYGDKSYWDSINETILDLLSG